MSAYNFKVPDPRMRDEYKTAIGHGSLNAQCKAKETMVNVLIGEQYSKLKQLLSTSYPVGSGGDLDSRLLYQASIKDGEYVSSDDNE